MVIAKKRLPVPSSHHPRSTNSFSTAPDLHGASIIDAHGREIPITEGMIQNACHAFMQAWDQARQPRS